MEEIYPGHIESIYIFKQLHDRGMADGMLSMYRNVEIDSDIYYEISYEAIGSVFADTSNYYNQEHEFVTWVFIDPLLDEFCKLCQEYEHRHNKSEDENTYRKDFENIIRSGFTFNSYDYDFNWKLSASDRGRKRLLLFTGPEFSHESEVPCGLMDIYDGLEYCVGRLRAEVIGKKENIVELQADKKSRKEAA